ncbi:trichohyalin-like [Littorina saxatilis]|uniref:Uncharacterized protein n=1 Tax=Littorina saxatilis TaxID=31220 RepID=A0AAN9GA56_9CAEN
MGEVGVAERKQVLQHVFQKYDAQHKGELTPIQLQILHGDLRMGGISLPQVQACIKYTCVGEHCQMSELYDLLQEMDRRYFLIQDVRWEYSMLDRESKDTISVEQARWLVQAVHGKYFSKRKWERFLKSRAVPGSGVGFAEVEVMLCDIPSKTDAEDERRLTEQDEDEKLRKRKEFEDALAKEKEKMKQEKEDQHKRKQNAKDQEEEDRRKRRDDEEQRRRLEEAERLRREQEEEEERLRKVEEEERKRKEADEEKYRDAEMYKGEAERAEKDADEKLNQLRQSADGKNTEEEERILSNKIKEHRNKRIRYQLKVAIKSRDKFQLEYSVTEFKKAELSDDDMDMEKAQKLLKQIGAKDGLHKAMSKREIQDLEKAMTFVRKHGFEAELAREMHSAGILLGRLRRLERIRHEILELKQSTVAEIRSYTNPPPIVHTVMTVVFLLLGHAEKETKIWKAVQALVGKTGKESLKRRCLELKSDALKLGVVKRGKTLLGSFELDDVRDISAGAATFFVWATAIIEDVMDQEEEKTNAAAK